MKPLLIIVGADKGGVGKTTVTRVLTDYLEAAKFPFRAYDTESPRGVLKRFRPAETEVVDLTEVTQQMKVFDTLQVNPVTVVDIRAGLLSPTLKTLADVGLLEMVAAQQVTLVVLHVLGPSLASLEEIEETASAIPGAHHFLVKNHINKTQFFNWDEALAGRAVAAAKSGVIEVPQLAEMAVENVDTFGVTFTQFVNNQRPDGVNANPPYSFVLKGYVRTWMKDVFGAFDRANINGIAGMAVTS